MNVRCVAESRRVNVHLMYAVLVQPNRALETAFLNNKPQSIQVGYKHKYPSAFFDPFNKLFIFRRNFDFTDDFLAVTEFARGTCTFPGKLVQFVLLQHPALML